MAYSRPRKSAATAKHLEAAAKAQSQHGYSMARKKSASAKHRRRKGY